MSSSQPNALPSALAQRWRALREHVQLRRELAAYSTAAARDDLDAQLAEEPGELAAPVRRLLRRQASLNGSPASFR